MKKEEFIKRAADSVKEIKKEYDSDVIKEHCISNLVDMNTGRDTGIGVEIQLSTRYNYTDNILNGWKSKLDADSFYINVKRNQLRVHFIIHF